jgi:hypothetical protein
MTGLDACLGAMLDAMQLPDMQTQLHVPDAVLVSLACALQRRAQLEFAVGSGQGHTLASNSKESSSKESSSKESSSKESSSKESSSKAGKKDWERVFTWIRQLWVRVSVVDVGEIAEMS